jgi:gamma-glutamylcyclotransferase (GGCT)/AIG2-like uncharacterized protein YtfP
VSVTYFAYGTNMAADVMASHCPTHRVIGVAELRGHGLAFRRRSIRTGTGVADVMPTPGRSVWGVLYELEDSELPALDAKEGAGWAYDRVAVTVWPDGGGEPVEAVAYRVAQPEPTPITPSDDYVSTLLTAAADRGLPPSYVDELEATARVR